MGGSCGEGEADDAPIFSSATVETAAVGPPAGAVQASPLPLVLRFISSGPAALSASPESVSADKKRKKRKGGDARK